MFYTDSPEQDARDYYDFLEKEQRKLPVCIGCRHHIQDEEAYCINGDWICEDCIEDYRKEVSDD